MSAPLETRQWTLRQADRGDAASLVRLYRHLASADDPELDEAAIADFFAVLARYPHYEVLIAEDERGAAIGTYSLVVIDNLNHGGRPFAVVESVVVDPAARGCGLGRGMMDDARRRAAAAGCYKLTLSSNQQRTQAHAFYESLGFQRHGYSFYVTLDAGA